MILAKDNEYTYLNLVFLVHINIFYKNLGEECPHSRGMCLESLLEIIIAFSILLVILVN